MPDIKATLEFLAFLGATLFFGFKLFSGFFIHNLAITIKCERAPSKEDKKDTLVITTELSKGNISAMTLHDIQALISYDSQQETIPFKGFLRSSYSTEVIGKTTRKIARPTTISESAPLLNLVPGESTTFSCHTSVPSDKVITIELVILGTRSYIGKGIGQWRCSAVSTPIV